MKKRQYLILHQKQTTSNVVSLQRRIQSKITFLIIMVAVLYAGLPHPHANAQWLPKNYLMKTDPAHAKPRYWEDPNVWVYTPEFAKRFGMPEKWASDELKGAQAIAYRIVFDRYKTCGWFSDKESCRYAYTCVMDLYTDHDAGMPWEPGSPPMGVQPRMSGKSATFLSPQKRSDNSDWDQVKNKYDRKRDVLGIANRAWLTGKPTNGKSYAMKRAGRLFVYEYVRNVFPNLDYLSFSAGCLLYEHPENVRLRLASIGKTRNLTAEKTSSYELRIPYPFMLRMAEYMKERYEEKSLWTAVKKRMRNKKEE